MKGLVTGFLGLILSTVSVSVFSAPYLYTFTGNIVTIEVDGVFLGDIDFDNDYSTTDDTFMVGDAVEYTYLVDFDVPGFCAGPMGTTYSSTCTGLDIPDSATADYFFVDLISATKLAPPTEEDTTFNFGLNLVNLGSLTADSAVFVKSPFNEPATDWVARSDVHPGTILIGTDGWAAPNGNSPYGRINSSLELTSIKPYKCKKGVKSGGVWEAEALEGLDDSIPDTSGNLIDNPSFGTGDTSRWIVRDQSRTSVVNSVMYSGNYSLALEGDPNCYKSVVQLVKGAIIGGSNYHVSGALSVTGNTMGRYLIQVRWYDASGIEVFGTRTNFAGSRFEKSFKNHETMITAPVNAVSVGMFLKANKADGVAYFDSLRIKALN